MPGAGSGPGGNKGRQTLSGAAQPAYHGPNGGLGHRPERLANLMGPALDRFLTAAAAKEAEEAAAEAEMLRQAAEEEAKAQAAAAAAAAAAAGPGLLGKGGASASGAAGKAQPGVGGAGGAAAVLRFVEAASGKAQVRHCRHCCWVTKGTVRRGVCSLVGAAGAPLRPLQATTAAMHAALAEARLIAELQQQQQQQVWRRRALKQEQRLPCMLPLCVTHGSLLARASVDSFPGGGGG